MTDIRKVARLIALWAVVLLVILDFIISLDLIRDTGDIGAAVVLAAPGYAVLTAAFFLHIKSRPSTWGYMRKSGKIAIPVYAVLSLAPLGYLFYEFSLGGLSPEAAAVPLVAPFFAGPLTVWLVYAVRRPTA